MWAVIYIPATGYAFGVQEEHLTHALLPLMLRSERYSSFRGLTSEEADVVIIRLSA